MNNLVKSSYTKQELLSIVDKKYKTEDELAILTFLELELSQYVSALVSNRRQNLTKAEYFDNTKACLIWNGKYLPSCETCLSTGFVPIRIGTKCTLNCDFCYEYGDVTVPLSKNQIIFGGQNMSFEVFKFLLSKQKDLYTAISWISRGESLLEIDKIINLMPFVSNMGIYQWLYTNGVHITEDILMLLRDSGLNEIRFNLQATNFSILDKVSLAKKYIENVVIESPMYSLSFVNYVDNIPKLIDIGITHINVPELQVFKHTPTHLKDSILYKHNRGYVSPISSILYIYDLLDVAEEKDWDITVNVCANSTKLYRGCHKDIRYFISYNSHIDIPDASYKFIIDEYFDKSGNDRWEIF